MAGNYLEQLAAEWYEFQGYFVRRNVLVGKLPKGGHESELDIIAFNPKTRRLVHIEPSMDADSWPKREQRFEKKFRAGRKYIPGLFPGLRLPEKPEQITLFAFASKKTRSELAGGRIMLVSELLQQIMSALKSRPLASAAVSEQYPILRTLQLVCEHREVVAKTLFPRE